MFYLNIIGSLGSIRRRRNAAWKSVGPTALAAVIALSIAGFSALKASDGDSRSAYYVKKQTARETFTASLQSIADNSPKLGPWYYVGPFDNTDSRGVDTVYGPEKSVDLSAEYTGKDGSAIKWHKSSNFIDGWSCNLSLFKDNDYTVAYVYREIEAKFAQDYKVSITADDGAAAWLNGERVNNLSDATLKLQPGKNRLLLKVWNSPGDWFFTFNTPDPVKTVNAILSDISKDFPVSEVNDLSPEVNRLSIDAANATEFEGITKQIADKAEINCFASTTFNAQALIAESDRDPADAVLRRTRALLADIKASSPKKDWKGPQTQFDKLIAKNKTIDISDGSARFSLYLEACRVRRQIAFSNPLLNFDKLLFAKHSMCTPDKNAGHMCYQYYGFNATSGGGIFILENPFGANPVLKDVLANSVVESGRLKGTKLTQQGSYLSPSLSYDGKTIFFAYTEKGGGDNWSPAMSWHIFRVNVDGTNLVQLTDGPWNEFDPYQMPNGRVVFISQRRGGYGRCHTVPMPVFTLHTMKPDGTDITCISYHESNEWNPAVNNDGMVIYSRWDYVDRGFNQAHHPWITTPDGRDARAIQGNYAEKLQNRPWLEVHLRPIPGSHKYLAVAGAHHAQAYGSLILIDPRIPDDGAMAQVRRVTPETTFPEAEKRSWSGQLTYGNAWPLSEKYYIGVYDPKNAIHGVWLIDCFGNRELMYRDPSLGCLGAIPFRPRKAPPIVPDMVKPADPKIQTGTMALMSVYDSLKPLPKGTRIAALRIMEVLPKTTPYANDPKIGHGEQKGARMVLGTVPVEEDGSAYFTVPAKKPVFFQALDANGLAVQSMRSDTYVHPGERLVCQGCHNQVRESPSRATATPIALRRAPSNIVRDVTGSYPFNYPRLVQGVLDRNCVDCHARNPNAPDLTGVDGGQNGWSRSYVNLRDYAFFIEPFDISTSLTIPGEFGARASRLYKMLSEGHHDLKLSKQDMHRLTLWMDSNSDFYGSYENTAAQRRGEVVWPTLY